MIMIEMWLCIGILMFPFSINTEKTWFHKVAIQPGDKNYRKGCTSRDWAHAPDPFCERECNTIPTKKYKDRCNSCFCQCDTGPSVPMIEGDCYNCRPGSECSKRNALHKSFEYLKVSSEGDAATARPSLMGKYKSLANSTKHNDFNIWEKLFGEQNYIYVTADGAWAIGKDLNSYLAVHSTGEGFTPATPDAAKDTWYYVEDDVSKSDPTFKVEVATSPGGSDCGTDEHNITCCPQMTPGDNLVGSEVEVTIKIPAGDTCMEYCQNIGRMKYAGPVTGITETKIKDKCFCEIGAAGREANVPQHKYQTCMFPISAGIEYLKVSSEGDAATARLSVMGKYKSLANATKHNHFPMWKKLFGAEHYIYVKDDGKWAIGSNVTNVLAQHSASNPTPASPDAAHWGKESLDNWLHCDKNSCQSDKTMKVQVSTRPGDSDCGKDEHGMQCCPKFIDGDNSNPEGFGNEKKLTETQMAEGTCEENCKKYYPNAAGITQHKETKACYCEFGEAKLASSASYQTCMFTESAGEAEAGEAVGGAGEAEVTSKPEGDSVVATLSSQYSTDDASKCLDGNVDTLCHSLKENNAFFMMEYPTLVTVTQVKVLARKDVNANRVKNVVVTVTDTKPTKGKPAAGTQLGSTYMGPASPGQWISFKSEAGILGKYIVVQQHYKGFLTFAEVEVTQEEKMCTGNYSEPSAGTVPAGTMCVKYEEKICRHEPGRWGNSFCYTEPEADGSNWGAECIPCSGDCQNKEGNGKDYVGSASITKSGTTCQKWSSQSPWKHEYGALGDHNYCRNPDDAPGVWCYTTDASKRFEYCDVQVCKGEADAGAGGGGEAEVGAGGAGEAEV